MEQQEILVGKQAMDQTSGCGVVHPVVVVADAEEAAAAQHGNQPDEKGDRSYGDRPKPEPASRSVKSNSLGPGDGHGTSIPDYRCDETEQHALAPQILFANGD